MKIGFVSFAHLQHWTGITRLIDRIASDMTRRGHEVTIIACEGKAAAKTPVSELDYPHNLITLDLESEIGRQNARTKIRNSGLDVCAASIGNTQLLYMPWLFYGSGIPFIVGDPADPRVFTFERWSPYEHFGSLITADAIQVLLKEYIPFYPKTLHQRITVIGNPAPPPAEVDFAKRRAKETRTIIAVGRFSEEDKRYSLLLRAFAMLHEDFPKWRLKLVGDGPYFEYYQIMADQLGIRIWTDFPGAVADTDFHYNCADIFCLPSIRAEGLPMVFGEASSHALPIIGFKTCSASAALITSDIGMLADNTNSSDSAEVLADALRSLMALSAEERERIGKNAQRFFSEQFSGETVFGQWEKLLTETFEKTRVSGATAIGAVERKIGMDSAGKKTGIGEEWAGLEPDSDVWTDELLESAAAEIIGREEPTVPSDHPDSENAEIVRLKCEVAELKRDLGTLSEKYSSLMKQFQAVAARKSAPAKKKRR